MKEAFTLFRYSMAQAVADRLIRHNPTDGVDRTRSYATAVDQSIERQDAEYEQIDDPLAEAGEWDDVDRTRIWTEAEQQHFAETVPIEDEMTRWVLVGLRTGLRPGEQCAPRWRDLNLEEGILRVAGTVREVDPDDGVGNGSRWVRVDFAKTGESIRDVTLSDDAVRVLKLQKEYVRRRYEKGKLKKRQAQYVFPSEGKNPYQNPSTIKDRLRHLILGRKDRKSSRPLDGVRWIPMYGYRHTHATDLLRHRWSTFMVAKRLGTSSEMIDRHYGHLLRDMVEPMMGSMTPLPGVMTCICKWSARMLARDRSPRRYGNMHSDVVAVVDALHDRLRLRFRDVAQIVGANESTLHRWRDGSTAPSVTFVRTLRSLARCLSEMEQRFDDWDAVNEWLRTPGPKGRTPLDRLYDGEQDVLLLELHDQSS